MIFFCWLSLWFFLFVQPDHSSVSYACMQSITIWYTISGGGGKTPTDYRKSSRSKIEVITSLKLFFFNNIRNKFIFFQSWGGWGCKSRWQISRKLSKRATQCWPLYVKAGYWAGPELLVYMYVPNNWNQPPPHCKFAVTVVPYEVLSLPLTPSPPVLLEVDSHHQVFSSLLFLS